MKQPPPDPALKNSIVECARNNQWTANEAMISLAGNWQAYDQTYSSAPLENIVLRFGTDHILTITKGSELVSWAPFTVKTGTGNELSIETTGEGAKYVTGTLYLCDQHLLIDPTADGKAFFYKRY